MSEPMRPALIDLPEQIETERLILRCPRTGDGRMMNEAILESLEQLRPWIPWAKDAPSVEDSEENIRRAIGKFQLREDLRFHLHLKDGTFVGGSGLHRIDWSVPRFDIGYWVRTSMVRRGYVTESTQALAQFALAKLNAARVEIRCDAKNERSWRVAERAGFTLEAVLRNECRDHNNHLRDTRIYAKLPLST